MPTGVLLLSTILSKLGRGRWATVVAQSHPVDHLRGFFKILKNISQLSAELANRSLPQPKPTLNHLTQLPKLSPVKNPSHWDRFVKHPNPDLILPKDCHQRGCFGRVITITGPSPAPCHRRLMVALLEGREIGHGNWEGRERVSFHPLIWFNGVNGKNLSFCFYKYYFIVM